MDAFSFVFSLFGLLLGLALAEVLAGFGNVLQERRKIRVGWQTPLLGVLVALDITSFWAFAWHTRAHIPALYLSLFVGLLFCGGYYLVARIVFPRDFAEWPDLDVHYAAHKRLIVGAVALLNLVGNAISISLGWSPFQTVADYVVQPLFYGGLLALLLVRNKAANIALLAMLALLYPLAPLYNVLTVPDAVAHFSR